MFTYQLRQMLPTDIRSAIGLQRLCFPPPFPRELLWNAEHMERHVEVFPEGQFVVVAGSDPKLGNPKKQTVLGSASSLIVSEENWKAHADRQTTCGGPFFAHHDPEGTTLFGADISVHPGYRGRGIGRMLYEARFELVRNLGLERYGTAARMPDFRAWQELHPGHDQVDYCEAVVFGKATDRTLTPLLSYGLTLIAVAQDHMQDEESGNAAAILEWVGG